MSFYSKSPPWIQNFGISLYGYYWDRRRFGRHYKRELRRFIEREKYTSFEWEKYQTNVLRKLLVHSALKVPFYRKNWKRVGISTNTLANITLSELSQLPTLSKRDLRDLGQTDLLAENQELFGRFYSSSGSTGTPTQIKISPRMHQEWTAGFEARIRNWAGLNRKTPKGTIGGRRVIPQGQADPPYYRYNCFGRQTYFSAYHISRNTAPDYLEGMYKYGVKYMTGYAVSNYLLAKFIQENNLKAPQLDAVITSSEKLTPEMRETFLSVYGCKSFDSYSGVEDCGLISECSHGKLHISPDLGIIEIVKADGTPAKNGEIGEAICTGLLNYDQPLIRYRIGDLLRLDHDQTCGCGRNMPVVSEIIGRLEDTVYGPDGRAMVRFHGIFVGLPEVIESQIIQKTLSHFDIKIVATENIRESTKATIRERMKSQLGEVVVDIRRVEEIPRTNNGKIKAVISLV